MAEVAENLGEIIISPEVLEVIVGITTAKIEGVYSLRNKNALAAVGKKSEGRGVYIDTVDDRVIVDIYVYLAYGVKVPLVASAIQKEVSETVSRTTDITIDEINIHVLGIVSEGEPKPEFEDLFKEGFFDVE